MEKRTVFFHLALALMIVAAACAAPAQQQTQPVAETHTEVVEEPATEAPAESPDKFVSHPPEKPFLPYLLKPRLEFTYGAEGLGDQAVGFTFPDGTIALKAAPFWDIYSYPYGDDPDGYYTPVGLVEFGDGSDSGVPPGIYLVMLDLQSIDQYILGEIRHLYEEGAVYTLYFERIPQLLNPMRFDPDRTSYAEFTDSSLPPDNSVTLTADGVCFILKTGDPSMGEDYVRYCSEQASVLSPQVNYKPQYEGLIESIGKTAEYLGMENDIQYEQIISEKEDLESITRCADKNLAGDLEGAQLECGSDITVAPVKEEYYLENYAAGYDQMKSQSFLEDPAPLAAALPVVFQQDEIYAGHFPVPVATVQVLSPIDTDPDMRYEGDTDIIQPGYYRLDYWFDANEEFYAATISGYRYADEVEVRFQPVPAVPATFVNADGSDQAPAQISTCRIFRRCVFWQQICP